MNYTPAWSFLVSRNQYLDYRTIVAPDFICNADVSIILAKVSIGEVSKPETAYYQEIEHPSIGKLTLIFRVILATGDNTGLSETGVLTDGFGRKICLIEGIVIKEFKPDFRLSQITLKEIHEPLMECYRKFWGIITPVPAEPSKSFELSNLEPNKASLQYITLNRYIEQSEPLSLVTRQKSTISKQWQVKTIEDFESEICSIVSFSDGNRIAVGCDQEIIVYDLLNQQKIKKFSGSKMAPGFKFPTPIALSPTEEFIVSAMVGGLEGNLIQLWDIKNPEEKKPKTLAEYGGIFDLKGSFFNPFSTSEKTSNRVKAVALTPDGKFAISSTINGNIKLWDTQEENLEIVEFSSHSKQISALAVDNHNFILASGDVDGYIKFWNLRTLKKEEIMTRRIAQQAINALAFSPDGKMLASGTDQGKIKLWDTKNGEEYSVNWQHSEAINTLAFSPDGCLLASGSNDHKIRLWDVKNQQSEKKSSLPGHTDAVTAVVFTPDGQKLISGGKDRKIRVWQPVQE
ncbi:WD40 repeat domain-containing protein [Planktothrix agardhii]|jgi:WD40 repeat protein|uniref:Serine/threonine-protein kinase PkwA n=1 Tax=Planktothrix agardhii TaxID=1160 RepID=A0AAD1V4T4_PLAAG|nr:WD40 repeat domain-containing protein [Planktothrix agardhii]MCF3605946.1 WD40 repeat domain-containing protein [Planktothrix agardhii 1033]MCB8749995.1 WD40 repeat domain-containing protein [Planktothrix agardhii 1810]MCB8765525.1 WD40 repeat domain-containing protein [Planktothrix agardhii 1809]MCB8783578.1 WD40 repeat domain-containing protein [Planktothrix agardhii 1808]MCF3565396.1 WD40 repeat domain-containing protein [Planktothrix agardhii 1807]